MRAHVEELGNDSLAVTGLGKDALQGWDEVDVVVLFTVLGHPDQTDDNQHEQNDQANGQIRGYQHTEVGLLDGLKLLFVEQGAVGRIQGMKTRLNEIHGHEHAQQGTHRIERLGQVQTTRGRLLGTHGENVWVTTGLQEGKAAGQNEIGYQERIILACHLGREEEEGTERIQPQPQQDTGFVGKAADEHGRRESHGEITAVKGYLHQRTVGGAHAENLGKCLDHRIGNVVGEAPKGKTGGYQNKRNQIVDSVLRQDGLFTVFHGYMI